MFIQTIVIAWSVTQVSNILKYLFPVPKEDSRRVITFANQEDFISFRSQFVKTLFLRNAHPLCFRPTIVMQCLAFDHRHHTYKKTDHKNIELNEVGPRFEMKCEWERERWARWPCRGVSEASPFFFFCVSVYMIKLGTLENENTADVEWRHHAYTHTAKKRRFISLE